MKTKLIRSFLVLTVLLVAVVPAALADNGTDTSALREAVTAGNIMDHLEAFQAIADANDGNRETTSDGYDASVAYVAELMEDAGYYVTIQSFEFFYSADATIPVLERVQPSPITSWLDGNSNYPDGDFATMTYSGSGSFSNAAVIPVDLALADPDLSTSGCEPEDFDGLDFTGSNDIALIQRGFCYFSDKAVNAENAGAEAVIVFNQGNAPDREDLFFGTLGGTVVTIPVLSASFAVGQDLAVEGSTANLSADTINEIRESQNVIADTPGGRDDRVVVVGAHLDSAPEGPGINDNGSGSAMILEVALQMAELDIEPRNKVRFAWWGAEEYGLFGSEYYVTNLSAREFKKLALNLNFDMIASPNYVRFVYDGDGSATPLAGPNGSGNIEQVFLSYFAEQGLPVEPTAFDGRSDYGPFIDAGIPAGGLFTGADGSKTAEEVDIYGGTEGIPYDSNYHTPDDDLSNIDETVLEQMSDAAAHTILTFAMTTSAVNGTDKGKGVGQYKDGMEYAGSKLRK